MPTAGYSKYVLQTAGFDGVFHSSFSYRISLNPPPARFPNQNQTRHWFVCSLLVADPVSDVGTRWWLRLSDCARSCPRAASRTTPITSSALPPRVRTTPLASSSSAHTTLSAPVRLRPVCVDVTYVHDVHCPVRHQRMLHLDEWVSG